VEGLPAIEELIYKGVNVNVTLLFSVHRYEEVIDRYFKGLERRLQEGLPLEEVCSVASFFVSRVDTKVDKYLEEMLTRVSTEDEKRRMLSLMGRAAVANAKMAYVVFKRNFSSDRFLKLRMKGARVQKLLFGSTSTKNPAYSDVLYVEELIGPATVNTMPDVTWKAFKDHGRVARTLDDRVEEAEKVLQELESLGINLHRVTEDLEKEGVKLFEEAFDALLEILSEKKNK
ncbi:MAG: transaldolase, partial [Nitrospirae bacterium]